MQPRVLLKTMTTDELLVRSVQIDRTLAWPVGRAKVRLAPGVKAPGLGDIITLVGDDGGLTVPLLTGQVFQITSCLDGLDLLVLESSKLLADLRVEKTFQASLLSAIINDFAVDVGLTTNIIEPGLSLTSFTFIKQRLVLAELMRLASSSGLCLFVDCNGQLNCQTSLMVPGSLVLTPLQAVAKAGAGKSLGSVEVAVCGEGALGSNGPGAENWLLADPSAMTIGNSSSASHARKQAVLKNMADLGRCQLAEEVRLTEAKSPIDLSMAQLVDIDLFANITLLDFGAGLDGLARVVGLAINFNSQQGFRLDIRLNKIT